MPAIRRPGPAPINKGSDLVARVRIALGQEPDLVLWRCSNAGAEVWDAATGTLRFQLAGLGAGAADLIGILRLHVPISIHGHAAVETGRFFALECKAGSGRARPNQLEWIALVHRFGGFAAIVKSEDDAKAALARARMGLCS